MFGVLFLKECRQVLRSLVYYIYVVVFVLFMYGQMGGESWEKLQAPAPGQSDYGETVTHDENQIMEGTLSHLAWEVSCNSFATYPIGFYKEVNLTEEEQRQAEEILKRCTEIEGLTYQEFETAMEEICRLVGAGSAYEKRKYENRIKVPMTYEQAKEEFDDLCGKDRLTRAYMRLFCDYAGIVLAILPVFVGISRVLRDKRAKAQQVIFSKPASGALIIMSRYFANLFMLVLPVIVTAFLQQQPLYDKARAFGVQVDIWAFVTVPGVWLLPEIMIVLALSFFITEFTDTVFAVFVQTAWGIASLFGAVTLVGDFGLKLVARWNTFGQTAFYASQEKELLWNRGYYFVLAVICVILTVVVYGRKRKKGGSLIWKNTEN